MSSLRKGRTDHSIFSPEEVSRVWGMYLIQRVLGYRDKTRIIDHLVERVGMSRERILYILHYYEPWKTENRERKR